MKLHIVTVGAPKLGYAKAGWNEYLPRLQRFHTVRVTHLHDKWADDAPHILATVNNAYVVALEIEGRQFSSPELATFLEQRALEARELCFIIGGPNGLPSALREHAQTHWSFSKLTLPHDLAMLVLLETLYRASTITAGLPYHK